MDFTTRLGLNKPNPDPVTGDPVDVSKLNQNADRIDDTISFTICVSTLRPAAPFSGQAILETDTGKAYVWGGSGWLPLLIGDKAQVVTNLGIGTDPDANAARKLKLFWGGTTGGLSMVLLEQSGAAAASRALGIRAGGEANERYTLDFDGKMQWGPGTAGTDITLGRSGAGTLDLSNGSLVAGGVPIGTPADIQKFSASGTWNKPARAKRVRVRLVAGGGAGGGSVVPAAGAHSKGGGGGGGGYCDKWFDASALTSTVAVTIGAGGVGAVGSAQGASGGTTSFGSFISATGGQGGFCGTSSTATYGKNGGPGGSTFTGSPDLQVSGCFGLQGGGGATLGTGGPGGASHWGGGGAGAETLSSNASVAGGDAIGWGGGGGGAASSTGGAAAVGGDGKAGYMIVESYY